MNINPFKQALTRAVFALKTPSPPGSEHYRSGWDDGLEAAIEAVAEFFDQRPSAVSVVPPATNQTALRELVAEALLDHLSRTADIRPGRDGDLAFMPEVTDAERLRLADAVLAVLPAPDRAAVLNRAADGFDRHAVQILDGVGNKAVFVAKALRDQAAVWREAAETLRRLAAEAPHAETPDEAPPREPHPTEADLRHALAVLDRFHGRDTDGPAVPETVHACPPDGSGLTPCCGRTPFELPRTDRISSEPAAVTCAPAVVAQPGKEN